MNMLTKLARSLALVSGLALLTTGVGCAAQAVDSAPEEDDKSAATDEQTGTATEAVKPCSDNCPGALAHIYAFGECQKNCNATYGPCMGTCANSGGAPYCYSLCAATTNACNFSC